VVEAVKVTEILVVEWERGTASAGTIGLIDGKLKAFPQKGYEVLMANILEEQGNQDAEAYLEILPQKYSGSLMRARRTDPRKRSGSAGHISD